MTQMLGSSVMPVLDLAALVGRFRQRELPRQEWTHTAHLLVGAVYVHELGPERALGGLRQDIRALNESHGTKNSASSGYHETITVAYVRLLHEFLSRFEPPVPLLHRTTALLSDPLADKHVLFAFWSRDLLMSSRARTEWVAPDLAPLELARVSPEPSVPGEMTDP